MPYFSTESVVSEAAQVLAESRLAANSVNARIRLSTESRTEQLGPVPEEPAAKPAVISDIFSSHSSLLTGLRRSLRTGRQTSGGGLVVKRQNSKTYLNCCVWLGGDRTKESHDFPQL